MIHMRLAPMRPITKGPGQYFFGYFDKSPWAPNTNGKLILAHRTTVYDRMPNVGEPVEIGVIDDRDQYRFDLIGRSRAWNLQQGAMAQWLSAGGLTVIYNDIVNGEPRAICVELSSGQRRTYERPIAAVAPDGRCALSINFGRLTEIKPEYGYAGLRDPFGGECAPEEDGIWHIDLATGRVTLVLSLKAIVDHESDNASVDAVHYINHPLFNRNGDRFCFLHRSISLTGTEHTRLMSCRANGADLQVLVSGMASHFGWRNASELLAWAGERPLMRVATAGIGKKLPIGVALKKIYRALGKPAVFKSAVMRDRYLVFNHADGSSRSVVRGVLQTDGHCSFSSDGQWFVTDTYADRHGTAMVYICHWPSEAVYAVQEIRSRHPLDGAVRCDLHPRWHPSKPLICVDSAHSGERQMYEIDVSGILGS